METTRQFSIKTQSFVDQKLLQAKFQRVLCEILLYLDSRSVMYCSALSDEIKDLINFRQITLLSLELLDY